MFSDFHIQSHHRQKENEIHFSDYNIELYLTNLEREIVSVLFNKKKSNKRLHKQPIIDDQLVKEILAILP